MKLHSHTIHPHRQTRRFVVHDEATDQHHTWEFGLDIPLEAAEFELRAHVDHLRRQQVAEHCVDGLQPGEVL